MTRLTGAARRGMALFAALSLLTLLGLLTVGAFATTMLSQRAERMHQTNELLDAMADYAAVTILSQAAQYDLADLPLGVATTFTVSVPQGDRVRAAVSVTRLPSGVVWLSGDASLVGTEQGHRRIGVLARFRGVGATPPAALVARGTVVLGDSVRISADSSGDVDCRVHGSVAATAQRTDSASFFLTGRQLAALDSSPAVRHVRGDTTIAGGTFTGILIVDGNATITGPFSLDGLLIARGSVSSSGGLTLRGAAMAYSADSAALKLANAQVEYSPCAIARAFRTALPPKPVRQRSWFDLP